VIQTTVQNIQGSVGNLVVDAGSNLSITGNLKFVVDNTLGTFGGEKITLIRSNGGQTPVNLDNITVESDRFSTWNKVRDEKTGSIIFTSKSQIEEIVTKDKNDAGIPESIISSRTIKVMSNALPNTQVDLFDKEVSKMSADSAMEAISRTTNSINVPSAQINTDIANTIEQVISARIADSFTSIVSFAFPEVAPVINNTPGSGGVINNNPALPLVPIKQAAGTPEGATFTGIAAGDDPARYGLWSSPIYVDSNQATNNFAAGYKAITAGITFGFDTKVNDDAIVGAALSVLSTTAKFKGYKSGDKAKMESLLWSLYGLRQLTNNFFVQSVVTFGSTKVHNTEYRRISNTATQVAEGRYTSMSFSSEVLGGYNKVISNKFVITPMVGLDYKLVNDASYNETGAATNQNRKVMKKANDRIDFVAGLRVSSMPFIASEMEISPEIHGFIRQDLTNKKIVVDLDIDSGTNELYATDSSKPVRTQGNIGVGVNAKYHMIDLSTVFRTKNHAIFCKFSYSTGDK